MFERFRQATPKTEEVYGGSGLGLSISRKLCQLHGGEIGVSSKEGVGSTFGFFFKVRRVGVDGRAPPEDEQLGKQAMRQQVQETAKGTPLENIPEKDVQEDLKHPEHKDLKEVAKNDAG